MICVNKFDLNPAEARIIEDIARERDLTVLKRISFDPIFTKAMVQGKNVFEYNTNSEAGRVIKQIWGKIGEILRINK